MNIEPAINKLSAVAEREPSASYTESQKNVLERALGNLGNWSTAPRPTESQEKDAKPRIIISK